MGSEFKKVMLTGMLALIYSRITYFSNLLLPTLLPERSLIILDNAKYHTKFPEDIYIYIFIPTSAAPKKQSCLNIWNPKKNERCKYIYIDEKRCFTFKGEESVGKA